MKPMTRRMLLGAVTGACLAGGLLTGTARSQEAPRFPFMDRLKVPILQATQKDVRRLRKRAVPKPTSAGYQDVRTIIHAHSYLSHDSKGTPAEIIQAAKEAGVRAIFMSDHYTPDRKFLKEALRGEKEGVLFVPGSELSDGLLAYRMDGVEWPADAPAAEVLRRLNAGGGFGIVAHPELRKNWDLPPFAGMEIYNTHANVEAHLTQMPKLSDPTLALQAFSFLNIYQRFPEEAFGAVFDPETPVLKVWDDLGQKRRVVGVAGNDSHQNVGVIVEATEKTLVASDPGGKKLGELSHRDIPAFLFGLSRYQPGQRVLERRLDPYPVSFRYVSTHILSDAVTEEALVRSLLGGRVYVAFDWLADPSGFAFTAEADGKKTTMGEEVRAKSVQLRAQTSMTANLRLIRNGQEVRRVEGDTLEFTATDRGVYRVEAWVTAGGRERAWIYSNPIYLR